MLAVKQQLIHQLPVHAVIASFGYDEVPLGSWSLRR
jgi:hypothetical protein